MSRVCIGLDNGNFAHKLYDHSGESSTVLSRAKIGQNHTVSMMGDKSSVNLTLVTDNVPYTAGKLRNHEVVNPHTFPETPLSRILMHYAIAMHRDAKFLKTDNLEICTGIPLGRYYKPNSNSKDEKLIASIESNLSKPVTVYMPDGSQITREFKVHVKPQTFCAWYAYILEEEREDPKDPTKVKVKKLSSRMKTPVAFIDVGGGTTEICVIEDQEMDCTASGSEFVGSNNIRETLSALIADKFEMESVPSYIVDMAMEKKIIVLDDKDINVTDLYNESTSQANAKLVSFIKNKLGERQRELGAIRLIGGGCQQLGDAIAKSVQRSRIVDNPQMENAKGLYLLLRHLMNR